MFDHFSGFAMHSRECFLPFIICLIKLNYHQNRFNDIDRATNAKSQVEQKQREEAKTRKETEAVWENKVSLYKKNLIYKIKTNIFFFLVFQTSW